MDDQHASFSVMTADFRKFSKTSRASSVINPCRSICAWIEKSPRCRRSQSRGGHCSGTFDVFGRVKNIEADSRPNQIRKLGQVSASSLFCEPSGRSLETLSTQFALEIGLTPSMASLKSFSSYSGLCHSLHPSLSAREDDRAGKSILPEQLLDFIEGSIVREGFRDFMRDNLTLSDDL